MLLMLGPMPDRLGSGARRRTTSLRSNFVLLVLFFIGARQAAAQASAGEDASSPPPLHTRQPKQWSSSGGQFVWAVAPIVFGTTADAWIAATNAAATNAGFETGHTYGQGVVPASPAW